MQVKPWNAGAVEIGEVFVGLDLHPSVLRLHWVLYGVGTGECLRECQRMLKRMFERKLENI